MWLKNEGKHVFKTFQLPKKGLHCATHYRLLFISFDEVAHIEKITNKNLEDDLDLWQQSYIYKYLQLEQQKRFQTTFMQPLTQRKTMQA